MPGVRQIERRRLITAETDGVDASNDLVAEQLVRDHTGRTEARQELRDEAIAMAAHGPAEKQQRLLRARTRQRVELRDDFGDRVIPRDRRVAPIAAIAG